MKSVALAVRKVLSKYATFSGRASRAEFWWWYLALVLCLCLTGLVDGALIAPMLGFEAFQEESGQPLSLLLGISVILPNLAVGVRRLHDTGRSGWWILIGLIPLLGTLVLLYFYIQKSEEGENGFGDPDPL